MNYLRATSLLLGMVVVGGIIGWSLIFVTGIGGVMMGWTALLVVVVAGSVGTLPKSVTGARVWQLWLLLSGVGLLVNTAAITIQGPIWLRFGLFHPWFVLLGIGYVVSAVYKRGDARLDTVSRYILSGGGILSVVGLAAVLWGGFGIQTMTVLLLLLTIVPTGLVAARFLLRARNSSVGS